MPLALSVRIVFVAAIIAAPGIALAAGITGGTPTNPAGMTPTHPAGRTPTNPAGTAPGATTGFNNNPGTTTGSGATGC